MYLLKSLALVIRISYCINSRNVWVFCTTRKEKLFNIVFILCSDLQYISVVKKCFFSIILDEINYFYWRLQFAKFPNKPTGKWWLEKIQVSVLLGWNFCVYIKPIWETEKFVKLLIQFFQSSVWCFGRVVVPSLMPWVEEQLRNSDWE